MIELLYNFSFSRADVKNDVVWVLLIVHYFVYFFRIAVFSCLEEFYCVKNPVEDFEIYGLRLGQFFSVLFLFQN